MTEKFVSLVRVSTSRQGDSGLGLLAQKEQVEQHIRAMGGELVQEFVEVESGRKIQRPMLEEAIALAKAYNATLIIAKWDRISRDAHYLLGLQKSGVKLIAADNPNATELTIGILAVIAQDEAKRISDRVTELWLLQRLEVRYWAHTTRTIRICSLGALVRKRIASKQLQPKSNTPKPKLRTTNHSSTD